MSDDFPYMPVDAEHKATELRIGSFAAPHMRAFHLSWLGFMQSFISTFSAAPMAPYIRDSLSLTKTELVSAGVATVTTVIGMRVIMGPVCDKLGPRYGMATLLLLFAPATLCLGLTTDGSNFLVCRMFIGITLATFVTCQYWASIMFTGKVVGLANATAGGWGNLGGGLTQTIMPLVYRFWHDAVGLSLSLSWRLAMLVPATLFLVLAIWIYFCSQDMTTGKFNVASLGKSKKADCKQYLECLKDYRVVLMIMQYGACFGCELVMNTKLAMHFSDYFDVDLVFAGALAMSFGAMNLFARSLGGIASDWASVRWGMCGRLWMHFLSLLGQAIFLFGFGLVDQDMGWPWALFMVVMMAIFVNAAEGTSYGIVPYMIPQHLAIVSAMVGAGGTAGAVIALNFFYRPEWVPETLDSFKLHAAYVLFWTLTVPLMRWESLGSMFDVRAAVTPEAKAAAVEDGPTLKSLADQDPAPEPTSADRARNESV